MILQHQLVSKKTPTVLVVVHQTLFNTLLSMVVSVVKSQEILINHSDYVSILTHILVSVSELTVIQ